MKRGFIMADLLIAMALLGLLAAVGISAAAAWRQQEQLLYRQRTLYRLGDSVLEELRAGVRPVRVGQVELKPDELDGTARGTLEIRPVEGQAGVVRCRVEVKDSPKGGVRPISVWLETEVLQEPG